MPRQVDRHEVRKLVDRGAQLVEVLLSSESGGDHLEGTIDLPLRQLDREAELILDRNRPVIVYCWDATSGNPAMS